MGKKKSHVWLKDSPSKLDCGTVKQDLFCGSLLNNALYSCLVSENWAFHTDIWQIYPWCVVGVSFTPVLPYPIALELLFFSFRDGIKKKKNPNCLEIIHKFEFFAADHLCVFGV